MIILLSLLFLSFCTLKVQNTISENQDEINEKYLEESDHIFCTEIINCSNTKTELPIVESKNKGDYWDKAIINLTENWTNLDPCKCTGLESFSDQWYCLDRLALFTEDFCICDLKKDSSCFDPPSGYTIKYCPQITESIKNSCYKNIIEKTNSFNLCKSLKSDDSEIYQAECKEEIAENLMDIKMCDLIDLETFRYSCRINVIDGNPNLDLCKDITDINAKAGCITSVAKKNKDYTFCDKIFYKDQINYCYYYVVELREDSENCDDIPNEWGKAVCLKNKAIKERNPVICELVYPVNLARNKVDPGLKFKCFKAIAIELSDPSVCDNINIPKWRTDCLKSI